MIDILDIFHSLVKEIKACTPTYKHYFGKIPENYKQPCYAYFLVYNGDSQSTYFVKDVVLDIQIVYFGKSDNYDTEDFEDKLNTMHKLKSFLSKFNLNVADRNLKFKYDFGQADEHLTINIQFKFKDGVVNTKYDEEQVRQMIENILINDKELI